MIGVLPLATLVADLDGLYAASEQLVLDTQLARWFREGHGIEVVPLHEPEWWR